MHKGCPKTKTAIVDGALVTGCSACLNTVVHGADYAAKYNRERSKDNHRADIVQRYDGDKINPEWVKLHEAKAIADLGQDKVTEILRNG